MGFELVGTTGTAKALRAAGIDCKSVRRASEMRPNIATMLSGGDIQLIINTPGGHDTRGDFYTLRQLAVRYRVTNVTTLAGAQAMTEAIRTARAGSLDVVALPGPVAAPSQGPSGTGSFGPGAAAIRGHLNPSPLVRTT